MAEAIGKIKFEFKQFVELQCGNADCIHNLYFDCNLKKLLIGKDGTCTNMVLKEKKEKKKNEPEK